MTNTTPRITNAQPAKTTQETVGKPKSRTPRITSEQAKSDEKEPKDYLRQYQFKKEIPLGDPRTDPEPGSKADTMKKKLLKDPVRTIKIPKPEKESAKMRFSVNINGYRLDLPKGVYLDLPKGITDVIEQSDLETEKALAEGKIEGDSAKEAALN